MSLKYMMHGLAGLEEKKYVAFNKEKSELVIYGVFIEYDDINGTTIFIRGENKNHEKIEMVTIVKDVKYSKYETVLKVSNKELKAKGKTAKDLLRNEFPKKWTLSNIDIINSTDKNNSYYTGERIPLHFPKSVINKKNNSLGLFTITLASDKNGKTIIVKNNVVTTITQKSYLRQLKDAVEDKPQLVIARFTGIGFSETAILEMKSIKNDKYKLELKMDIEELDKLKDNTTVDEIIHTARPANAVLNWFCSMHRRERHCRNGSCTWCNDECFHACPRPRPPNSQLPPAVVF
jgi:hypothetical protein